MLLSTFILAQKVALVLSGGGSKGIAHVGVIKALEENNIPIDYIVGVSMGSVVGGCYAAGYSAVEIDSLISSRNFQGWVKGDIHLENNYYFNDEDGGPSWISLDFSLDSLFSSTINSTLVSDLAINFVLAEQFSRQSEISNYNFDSLYVPFRAVASDIFTQNSEVIDSGSLGSAVRVSFSAPQFYRPIKVNNKYLFDGGLYNNFPVDVAQNFFQPDIIIGVNVSRKAFEKYPYDKDDELISDALIYTLLDNSEASQMDSLGVYIQPDLSRFSSLNFSNPQAMIDSGYIATMRKMDEIKAKIERRTSAQYLSKTRSAFIKKRKSFIFKSIELHNFTDRQKIFIERAFKFQKKEFLSLEDVKRGYYRLVSEEYFKTIYPEITYSNELGGFVLHLYGRPSNTFNVQLGGLVASRNVGHVYLGLKHYRFNKYFTKTYLNLFTSSFHRSAQFNTRFLLPTAKPIYIEPETLYNNWNYTSVNELFLQDNHPVTIYNLTDRKYGLNIGLPFGKQYQLLLSGHIINNVNHFSNNNVLISIDTLDEQLISGVRAGFSFSMNTLDRPTYASKGRLGLITVDGFRLKEIYTPGSTSVLENIQTGYYTWYRVKLRLEHYIKMGKSYSIGYLLEGHASNSLSMSNYKSTIINAPAFYPLQDSKTLFIDELRAYNYASVGLRNVISINKKFDARLEGYVFMPINKIISNSNQKAIISKFDIKEISLASTFSLVFHSPVGPIALNVNYYSASSNGFGFFAHFGYVLFSKTSME